MVTIKRLCSLQTMITTTWETISHSTELYKTQTTILPKVFTTYNFQLQQLLDINDTTTCHTTWNMQIKNPSTSQWKRCTDWNLIRLRQSLHMQIQVMWIVWIVWNASALYHILLCELVVWLLLFGGIGAVLETSLRYWVNFARLDLIRGEATLHKYGSF